MKKIILLYSISFLFVFSVIGQTTKKIRKIVPIQEKLTFALDGGLTSKINGKSRVYFEIKLPANTVEWYYVFSSQKDIDAMNAAANNINLVAQLTKIYDPTGVIATAASSLLAPSGSKQVNIYLFSDLENVNKFYNKTDHNLKADTWSYNIEGSIEAATQGKKKITDITKGTCYIGIQNPSFNSPIDVVIEVVAIVEEAEAENSINNNITSTNSPAQVTKTVVKPVELQNAIKENINKDFPDFKVIKAIKIDSLANGKTVYEIRIEKTTSSNEIEKENVFYDNNGNFFKKITPYTKPIK